MITLNDRLFYKEEKEKTPKNPYNEMDLLKLDLEIIQDNRCKAQLKNLLKELEE